MAEERVQRKLTTILAADVEGYSRLMGADWQPWIERVEPASVERMAFPLPDKPSTAVLPFANLSGDPKQNYVGDAISESITTALSRGKHFPIGAKIGNLSFVILSQSVDHVPPVQISPGGGARCSSRHQDIARI